MSAIRDYYLRFQLIQKEINDFGFERTKRPALVQRLKALLIISKKLDHRFAKANKGFLNPSEIEEENQIRNMSVKNLYTRLSGKK
jgi:hexosaminidase